MPTSKRRLLYKAVGARLEELANMYFNSVQAACNAPNMEISNKWRRYKEAIFVIGLFRYEDRWTKELHRFDGKWPTPNPRHGGEKTKNPWDE